MSGSGLFSQPENQSPDQAENEILTDLLIERHLFDWIFISSIFGVLSIGLYGLTSNRYVWGSLGLMLVIGLLIIALIIYWEERNRLIEEGKTPRKRTDALAIIVLILIFILISVIWNIVMEYLVWPKKTLEDVSNPNY